MKRTIGKGEIGMAIGRNLRELGLSQVELQRILGVNKGTTGKLVNGQQRLTPRMALRLSAALNLPDDYWTEMMFRWEKAASAAHLAEIRQRAASMLPAMRQTELIPTESDR